MNTSQINTPESYSPSKSLAWWEIASVVTSCLIVEWIILAFAGTEIVGAIPVLLAVGFMVFSHRARGETWHDLGFRFDNFVPAVRLLLLPTAVFVALILIVSWLSKGHHLTFAPLRPRFITLPLWALFQQYALQGFINRRAQLVLGVGAKSVLLVAVIFGFLHLPNPMLSRLLLSADWFGRSISVSQTFLPWLCPTHLFRSCWRSLYRRTSFTTCESGSSTLAEISRAHGARWAGKDLLSICHWSLNGVISNQ